MLRTLIREEVRAVFVEAKLLAAPAKTLPQRERERFMTGMAWVNVPYSSLIKEMFYEPYSNRLSLRFKSNNRIYSYSGVPKYIAEGLYTAWEANNSVGSYFLQNIKGRYPTV